jgi:biopolymer transport protein ExbB
VRGDRSALGRIIQIGLKHLNWPKSENVEAVQTRARHEVVRLESGLFVLEVIVGIAPLLGLLGAVSGLVTVFANLGSSATVSDPRGIAKGVSEALSTTIVGLAIAIPSLIPHSYFSKKIETMAAEMESLIADLLAKCYVQQPRWQAARETTPPPIPAATSYAPPSTTDTAPEAPVEEEVR